MIDRTRRHGRGLRLTRIKPGLILAPLILAAVAFGAPHLTATRQDAPPANPELMPTVALVDESLPDERFFIADDRLLVVRGSHGLEVITIPRVDPNTPVKDLLPTPPRVAKVRPLTSDDLTQVPEVQFQAPLTKETVHPSQETGFMLAKINHLNGKDSDGFLKALLAERQDLAGLSFAMGDACRTKGERSRQFAKAVETVRRALMQSPELTTIDNPEQPINDPNFLSDKLDEVVAPGPAKTVGVTPPMARSNDRIVLGTFTFTASNASGTSNSPSANFWSQYRTLCDQQDAAQGTIDKELCEHITLARIAALMQILGPESPPMRLGLVKHLSGIAHVEATRALARLAVFSAEDDVRLAAVAALNVRRERDYTDILVRGLRYPYPKVAGNAADAIVRLKRSDLVPQLVAMLEEPDPRAPVVHKVGARKVTVVNEMVRINHHRNCAMCHSPGTNGDVPENTLTAGIPLPNESLTSPSGGYRNSRSSLLVRIDVTYLRQDFSMLQAVADANPWPEMQRFDFLVRTRALKSEEVAAYQEQFGKNDQTRPSPYQKAALAALREITGRDTAPTGEAWRNLLELPARTPGKSFTDVNAAVPLARLH